MLPKKNKKILYSSFGPGLFLVFILISLFAPDIAYAAPEGWNKLNPLAWAGDAISNTFVTGAKYLLYGIFVVEGMFASLAFTLFNWAIDPQWVSLFFNLQSIYEMWRFVRDFFNLFFILILLFTAFAIIFQIQKYNNKKIILQLVIAALLVNFSFPISRLIIDATNVPMYFFVQQIGTEGGGALGAALSSSGLQEILVPGAAAGGEGVDMKTTEISQLLMAIIFMFIFSMTIMVLAVLFVVRLIALLVLVVFSSVGIVAGLVPGMEKLSKDWWQNFMKYALFGPAAMFMLLLATRFFVEIRDADIGLASVTTDATAGAQMQQMVAKMALFTFPIAMLWMAMGIGNSFSIAGSKKMVAWGQKWSKAIGKGAGKGAGKIILMPTRPVTTRAKAVGSGLKKGLGQGKLFGVKYAQSGVAGSLLNPEFRKKDAERINAKYGGFATGGAKGAKTELQKLHDKRVYEKVKENKDNNVSRSALIKDLDVKNKDIISRQAAALSLAENGDITTDATLQLALKALSEEVKTKRSDGTEATEVKFDNDKLLRVLDKAKDDAFGDMSAETYALLAGNKAMYQTEEKDGKTEFVRDDNGNRKALEALDKLNGKLKKEGQIKTRIDYEIKYKVDEDKIPQADAEKQVYANTIGKLSADDLAKQGSIHSALGKDAAMTSYLKEKADGDINYYQESIKKMSQQNREKWFSAGLVPRSENQAGKKREPFRPGMHADGSGPSPA